MSTHGPGWPINPQPPANCPVGAPGCGNADFGACPRCFAATGLGCPHGLVCVDCLTQEYHEWMHDQGVTLGSADEHCFDETLTEVQREWLFDFCARWDASADQGRDLHGWRHSQKRPPEVL